MTEKESNQKPSARWMLKNAIHHAHERLDMALSHLDIASYDGFVAYLSMNIVALRHIIPTIQNQNWRDALCDLMDAAKQDLNHIGALPPKAIDYDVITACGLGTFYVIAGSRLGAKILKKQVAQSPDVRLHNATAFFAQGPVDKLWKDVMAALDHVQNEDHESLITEAKACFALYEKAMNDVKV